MSSRSSTLKVILSAVLCAVWINVPAWAARTAKIENVTIPVYYVTDRELLGETFGPHRRYPTHCQHHMYYGTAFVEVANSEHKADAATLAALGWKASGDSKAPKICLKDKIDPTDVDASKKEFFSRLKKALDQSGKSDLCLFVHGAADGFEDCTQDAAELAYHLEKPIVLYSWPSDPKRRGYFIDGSNSEWSQGHFDQFLNDLLAFQSEHPLQVIAVAHSMGNRLMIRALPVVYGKGMVSDWELVSPDMDADTCRHYVMGYKQVNPNGKIRLYVSNKDKMLPLAQMLTGGYYRLGEAANPTVSSSQVKPGTFERIDFTAVDTGFTGHSIPFDLLSNMVHTDKPGEGLTLVDETEVKPSMLSRFAGKSEKFGHESNEGDFSKRVVRTK